MKEKERNTYPIWHLLKTEAEEEMPEPPCGMTNYDNTPQDIKEWWANRNRGWREGYQACIKWLKEE